MKKLLKKIREKKGFTLIEMIVVIAIIAILIALIAPNLQKFLNTAKQTKVDAAAKTMYTAASTYLVDQYVQGSPYSGGSWHQGDDPEDFLKDYFNKDEIGKNAEYTVTVSNGSVVSVLWEEDGLKSYYPKNSTPAGGAESETH